jgi:hypothetical protein
MRFRFAIGDLLWLTLVVALAVAWWLDTSGFFLALAVAGSLPLSFVVGCRARGRLRLKVTVACLFAVGWIGIAIYLEALRAAFRADNGAGIFGGPESGIPRLITIVGLLPAIGTGVLLWRTWVRSANEVREAENQYDKIRERVPTHEVI